jgi:hypothetical protein
MGIPLDENTKAGVGYTFVYFNGIVYNIITDGNYYLEFEEYDNEWVRLYIIPTEEKPQYSPVYVQWGIFDPVVLELDSDVGETYLLGSETGYAEK